MKVSRSALIFSVLFSFTFLCDLTLRTRSAESSSIEELDNLVEHPFRVQETLTLKLDGSEAASGIEFFVQTVNEVLFLSRDQWRVRREYPYPRSVFEFRRLGQKIESVNTANKKTPSPLPVTDEVWTAVVLSPWQLAKQWSLSSGSESFSTFLKRMRSTKEPLKNVEGDEMTSVVVAPEKPGGPEILRIKSSGRILHDNKTVVNLESVWELTAKAPLSIEDLNKSLLRSVISSSKN